MKRYHSLIAVLLLLLLLLPSSAFAASAATYHPSASGGRAFFIQNVGQFATGARFQLPAGQRTFWLANDAIWITLAAPAAAAPALSPAAQAAPATTAAGLVNLKLSFPGANPAAVLETFDPQAAQVSYFRGGNPANWQVGVPVWGGVRYRDLYPGLNLELSTAGDELKMLVVAQAGANPGQMQLKVEGAQDIMLASGGLQIDTAGGKFTLPLPALAGAAAATGPALLGNQVAAPFAAAPAAQAAGAGPAVDEPSDLRYATFLGGGSNDYAFGAAMDPAGNAYITGMTSSTDFPARPGFDQTLAGDADAFVVKLDSSGTSILYASFLGGAGTDMGEAIAVDRWGNAYVAGRTDSADFPAAGGPGFDNTFNGGQFDAFVVRLDTKGTTLCYATYLGGSDNDGAFGIAVDESGQAWVTGITGSPEFPAGTVPGFQVSLFGTSDAFVVKLNAEGTSLRAASFLGGSGDEWGRSIALDAAGQAYVMGWTSSPDFTAPGLAGYDKTYNGGGWDTFVVKVNVSGDTRLYATYLGGSSEDWGFGMAVDPAGNAYVAGTTRSGDFPAALGPGYDTTFNGTPGNDQDGFVVKLDPGGAALRYATYLGGGNGAFDFTTAVTIDDAGQAYVTGETAGTPYWPGSATIPGYDRTFNGDTDAFLIKLDAAGANVLYASYIGGNSAERGMALAVNPSQQVYVFGYTWSPNFPAAAGPGYDTTYNGASDAFALLLHTTRPVMAGGLGTVSDFPPRAYLPFSMR